MRIFFTWVFTATLALITAGCDFSQRTAEIHIQAVCEIPKVDFNKLPKTANIDDTIVDLRYTIVGDLLHVDFVLRNTKFAGGGRLTEAEKSELLQVIQEQLYIKVVNIR